jgi:hypothetical protein
MLLLQSNSD